MSTDIQKALSIPGDLDKRSRDFLSKALASNGNEEFDYIKYRKALNAIAEMGLNEETAFKSAFATAKTMGLTKTSLSNSAKSYLSVLMEEKSKFDEALANQVKTKIASKADQVQKLEMRIDEMKQKIAEMEKRIEEYNAKIDAADEEVEKEKQKINETQQRFESTFEAFQQVIKGDLERVSQYL